MTQAEKFTYVALEKRTKALALALGYRDQNTLDHSARVQALAHELAMAVRLSEEDLGALRVSAKFHDIGKIGIPDHVLMKPGRLNEEEWAIMHQHPLIGEQIVVSTELDGASQTAHIIRHHHERFDGNGYPDNLYGETIPIGARIISIVDSYDAMAHTRAYHQGRSHDEIMRVIEDESGVKHDPYLLRHFNRLIKQSRHRVR